MKALAAKIKADHQQAGEELKTLASTKHVTLPTALPPDQKNAVSRLDKQTGAAFDHAYAQAMVTDHRKAISEFERAAKSSDADVKAFAGKTLPALREHLSQSEQVLKKVGK